MANQGAKKRTEENRKHMSTLLRVILASNIPAFGAYKAYGLLKGTFLSGSEDCPEDEKARKKREKMEKKAYRGKFVKGRVR